MNNSLKKTYYVHYNRTDQQHRSGLYLRSLSTGYTEQGAIDALREKLKPALLEITYIEEKV